MDDLISRQAAIEAWNKLSKRGRTEFDQVLMMFPPVEPKRLPQPHKCVVYRDGECRYPIEACSECPKHEGMRAVLAERPKGEWKADMVYAGIEFYRCDQCEFRQSEKTRYCPNCGADMRGEK